MLSCHSLFDGTVRRVAFVAVSICGAPLGAYAQSTTACGPSVKAEVAKQIDSWSTLSEAEQLKLQASLYEKYKPCGTTDAGQTPSSDPIYTAARQCGAKISYLGSLFYEEMSCCGYDPQRRTFACPVKVKQPYGFGASPLPGSREYVLHCVADPSGVFHPVGDDSVHLADSQFSASWQFAVVSNAVQNLGLVQPMSGQPRRARSILSWNFKPTSCTYQPIWGDVLEYTIRLDQ